MMKFNCFLLFLFFFLSPTKGIGAARVQEGFLPGGVTWGIISAHINMQRTTTDQQEFAHRYTFDYGDYEPGDKIHVSIAGAVKREKGSCDYRKTCDPSDIEQGTWHNDSEPHKVIKVELD